MTEFIIEGKCIAKQRPRATKFGHIYTPKATHDYETLVGWSYLSVHASQRQKYAKETPVEVSIEVYEKIPDSWTKSKKVKAINQELFPTKKDLDNQIKSILDGLNGVAFCDDKQIVKIAAIKKYHEQDFVKVKIGEYKCLKQ